jgi:hypothetical protein
VRALKFREVRVRKQARWAAVAIGTVSAAPAVPAEDCLPADTVSATLGRSPVDGEQLRSQVLQRCLENERKSWGRKATGCEIRLGPWKSSRESITEGARSPFANCRTNFCATQWEYQSAARIQTFHGFGPDWSDGSLLGLGIPQGRGSARGTSPRHPHQMRFREV